MALPPPRATRRFHELSYAAGSWPITPRVIVKAEVMAAGRNPRFVVTSLQHPEPESLYAARGQDENFIKSVKNDLAAERTSDRSFLANHLRLFYACAAYVLHHGLRTQVLAHTEFARAEPGTVIVKLFKLAMRVVPKKRRVDLHLPTGCPVNDPLHRASEILYRIKPPPRPGLTRRRPARQPTLRHARASADDDARPSRLVQRADRHPPESRREKHHIPIVKYPAENAKRPAHNGYQTTSRNCVQNPG